MSGAGQSRLKNCPGLTASAFAEASTTRCLYSLLTHSCDTIGQSASSAGICATAGDGALLPTTNGSDANGSAIISWGPFLDPGNLAATVPKSRFFPIFK